MNVLIIGSGGREHALTWKVSQSPKVSKIYAAKGNAGIGELAECIDIEEDDLSGLLDFALDKKIDLTIVGPEDVLAKGIVDLFENNGLRIFGPSRQAAQIESSKVFAKNLMKKYGIPTAGFAYFTEKEAALNHIKQTGVPIVIKANGLAAGKGVVVADDMETARKAVCAAFDAVGHSGVVIEECLRGPEFSLLSFVCGELFAPMISVQDHKRALDGDRGPNTGGMGVYTPVPVVTEEIYNLSVEKIIRPVLKAMTLESVPFKGILYAGLMLTDDGPKVIEFNARFGDPETQVLLPLLKNDIVDVIELLESGRVPVLEWDSDSMVGVVLASGGYPGSYQTGKIISGLEQSDNLAFHMGTKKSGNHIVTNGGRVLIINGRGRTLADAKNDAYNAVGRIRFDGMMYRNDIGDKGIV